MSATGRARMYPQSRHRVESLLRQAGLLARRLRSAVRQIERINRLAAERRKIEEEWRRHSQHTSAEATPRLARHGLLVREIERRQERLEAVRRQVVEFRSGCEAALRVMAVEMPEAADLWEQVRHLHWPVVPGFGHVALEAALQSVEQLSALLSGWLKRSSEPHAGSSAVAPAGNETMRPAREADEVMTLREVAEWLKVNYQRAAELTRSGVLPSFRLGRQVRVRRRDLEEFMKGRRREG